MQQIILAEKPQAGTKIESVTGVKTIPLVGHLLGLQKQDHHWQPPYFRIKWVPRKNMKDKLNRISETLSDYEQIIVGTDYDVEGQLIALNVLRYSNIDFKHVKRMKFSSLEEEELLRSFNNFIAFDINLALEAETRHYLDWYFGMNISKVLTMLRNSKRFQLTPVGRVKSPTLKMLTEKEKEIGQFISKDIWYADVYGVYGESRNKTFEIGNFSFENEKHAQNFINNNLYAKVDHIDKQTYLLKQYPPNTDWMMRYGLGLGLSADVVMKILQDLYLNEYCSYPRTNSKQYLSHNVDTQKYLKRLLGVTEEVEEALGNKPFEGEEDDVHPAIYPIRVYKEQDLRGILWKEIVRCFVECHIPPKTETYKHLYINIDGDIVCSRQFPEDLDITKELELIYNLRKGQLTPPRRLEQKDIYDWMTENNMGTKDTRPIIISDLSKSYTYETREGMFINSLGMKIIDVLSNFCPDIISVDLTRNFENQITEVGKSGKIQEVLVEGKRVVTQLVERIHEHRNEIIKIL